MSVKCLLSKCNGSEFGSPAPIKNSDKSDVMVASILPPWREGQMSPWNLLVWQPSQTVSSMFSGRRGNPVLKVKMEK